MESDRSLLLITGALIFGVPLLTFGLAELIRASDQARPPLARFARLLQNFVLPIAALWVILRYIAELPADGLAVQLADTALALALVYLALDGLQLILLSFAGIAASVPKILIDLARLVLIAFGAAIVISQVWDVDLGGLVAALGVGSIVLGLALQNVIGGIVGGVFLASFRPFAIGDVIKIGDQLARVVQLDWRVVTLEVDGERILMPTAELNGKSVSIVGPADNPRVLSVPVDIAVNHSPETVRAALLEAAFGIPQLTRPDAARCNVTAIEAGNMRYVVSLPLSKPLTAVGARNELLSRFWYVAQRRGIHLEPAGVEPHPVPSLEDPEAIAMRADQLTRSDSFARPGLPLAALAAVSRLVRYRPGEALVTQGGSSPQMLLLLEGEAAVTTLRGETAVPVERLGPGDVYATRSMFRHEASPVRVEASGEICALAFPIDAMQAELVRSPMMARDIEAVLEARGQALEKVTRTERLRVA